MGEDINQKAERRDILRLETSVLLIGCRTVPSTSINGVVVTWVVAIDPPGVRFPLNAWEPWILHF